MERNSSRLHLDEVDFKIVQLLETNGKLSNKEVAEKIGLSVTPTFERIKRLERNGVIEGYSAKINRKAIGKHLLVYCQVSLKEHHLKVLEQFEAEIAQFEELVYCHHIAGDYDYCMLIEIGDMNEYQHFLKQKLAGLPNISNVQSSFVMSVIK